MNLLLIGIVLTLIASGITMFALERAFHSPRYADHHFRTPRPTKATDAKKRLVNGINGVLAPVIIFAAALPGYRLFFTDAEPTALLIPAQILGILLLYDFLYYAMHRWIFHHRKLMKYVHALHHRASTPSANESMFTHPIELTAGLLLFLLCTWIVGPVHAFVFVPAFFVYSLMNVIIHSGIRFPSGPLRLFNGVADAHHRHHGVNVNGYYASLSPIWDKLFRTAG